MADELNNVEQEQEQEETKTYTADEVNQLLQAEADKRVTQALLKQKKEYEKKLSLSKLDEQQREQAEKDIRIQELQEQLKDFQIERNKNEVMKTLGGRGLNPAFADLIAIGDDIGEAQERIEQLDKLFKTAVQEEVKKRLGTGAPRTGADVSAELTKEQFKKLTIAQQSKLMLENRDLYNKLSQ